MSTETVRLIRDGDKGGREYHSQCLAFRHLPPNSGVTGYATEGVLHAAYL